MNATKNILMTGSAGMLIAAAPADAFVPAAAHAQKPQRAAAIVTPAAFAPPPPLPKKPRRAAAIVPPAALQVEAPKPSGSLVASITLADFGFVSGFRLSKLGGREEIFLPLPPGAELTASELLLSLDD